ncbi:MAG: riboflavin synthase [Frankiaceae bacterium]|jgi:riboflavin synthase|nr:riboflavin synthase [Frankiaceae bacterium]
MFTGIVETLGQVVTIVPGEKSARLTVQGSVVPGSNRGDSICVNGVCLTAVDVDGDLFSSDVMAETLRASALGSLQPGDPVNLERAATASSRLGGHVVQGHVDGVGTVLRREPGDGWEVVVIEIPSDLMRYVVAKGSIALDGVSLTVASLDDVSIAVSLIPETLRRTTLGSRAVGDRVNVEVDVLAKHVERLLASRLEQS